MNDFREYSDYLMHYGIPGQRRGIRRYQNEDGSLTEEGKIRYLVNAEGRRPAYNGESDEQKIREYENTPVRFWGGSNGKKVYLSSEDYIPGNAMLYSTNKNGQNEFNSIWKLSERGISNLKHDKAVRKAAEILESIEHNWEVLKTHREELGKEADQKRENRVQHIEDKITKAEEKVKNIFKKFGF